MDKHVEEKLAKGTFVAQPPDHFAVSSAAYAKYLLVADKDDVYQDCVQCTVCKKHDLRVFGTTHLLRHAATHGIDAKTETPKNSER